LKKDILTIKLKQFSFIYETTSFNGFKIKKIKKKWKESKTT